ncbi:reverse transcriptase domain, reverse transcriptase zinc-binding domain protein, partial [Tanacetum coccineum]
TLVGIVIAGTSNPQSSPDSDGQELEAGDLHREQRLLSDHNQVDIFEVHPMLLGTICCGSNYGFQGTVQRKTKSVTPSRRKPNQIELFERVHKKAKGTGEWCDGRAKRVARQYHEKIKDKHAHEFENVDGGEQ